MSNLGRFLHATLSHTGRVLPATFGCIWALKRKKARTRPGQSHFFGLPDKARTDRTEVQRFSNLACMFSFPPLGKNPANISVFGQWGCPIPPAGVCGQFADKPGQGTADKKAGQNPPLGGCPLVRSGQSICLMKQPTLGLKDTHAYPNESVNGLPNVRYCVTAVGPSVIRSPIK